MLYCTLLFLVDLFSNQFLTPGEIKIKSSNAADRVITIDYMLFNPSAGQTHRLTYIPFLSESIRKCILVS